MGKVAKDVEHTSPWLRRHHGKSSRSSGRQSGRLDPKPKKSLATTCPYYKYHGALVGFAAYKNHVSLFGVIPDELMEELRPYKIGMGSVQFPLDKPLPLPLITKIVKSHAKMNETGSAMHV